MARFTSLSLLWISICTAQSISFGVKGGLPLSPALNAQANSYTPTLSDFLLTETTDTYNSAIQRTVPYTIGPAIEIRLWRVIKLEVDGFYSRAVYDYTSTGFNKFSSESMFAALKHTVDQVELPVLVKYEFTGRRRLHPFVAVGVSILYSRDRISQGIIDASTPGEPPAPPNLFNPSYGSAVQVVKGGPSFVAGAATSIRRLRISAELRYTRFTGQAINLPALQSNENQTKLIVGVLF